MTTSFIAASWEDGIDASWRAFLKDCHQQAGKNFDMERSNQVAMRGPGYVAVTIGYSYDCGGAHPDSIQSYAVWDTGSGKAVDPWTWFNAKGVQLELAGRSDASYSRITLSPVLRSALLGAWTRDDEDCKNAGELATWDPYPSVEGMVFQPDLPHVIQACADPLTLPWEKILPLLNNEGRRAVESIRADFANPPSR